jgi:hypothetical protein
MIEIGDYLSSDKQHPRQDPNLERMVSNAGSKAAHVELLLCHIYCGFNVF